MRAAVRIDAPAEGAMRARILSILDDVCRNATLQDVREWYLDSLADPGSLQTVAETID
jgi:hypothetical protein